MLELKDYSGRFRREISWADFSKETLVEALKLYGRLFMAIDAFWFLAVRERLDDRSAIGCDLQAWEKYITYEVKRIRGLFNIQGNDIESLFKEIQLSPWAQNLIFECDVPGEGRGVFRVTKCPTLSAIVKEGQGREKYFCREVEVTMFERLARCFDPGIRVRPLRLPPETLGTSVCCEWELTKENQHY